MDYNTHIPGEEWMVMQPGDVAYVSLDIVKEAMRKSPRRYGWKPYDGSLFELKDIRDPVSVKESLEDKLLASCSNDRGGTLGIMQNRFRAYPKELVQATLESLVERGLVSVEEKIHKYNKGLIKKYIKK